MQAQHAELQGLIDECQQDMNDGRVPWYKGNLAKRVCYLIGTQKGTRPEAELPLPPVTIDMPATSTDLQLANNSPEFADLRVKVTELQALIDECQQDMNENQVPWLGGKLAKRIVYLIGAQKPNVEVSAKAEVRLLPASPEDLLNEKIVRIIRGFHKRRGVWPSQSKIRKHTGRSAATRSSHSDIDRGLKQLESAGIVQKFLYEGKRVPRWALL